jgi:OmpA-OmpF porin, OOP family
MKTSMMLVLGLLGLIIMQSPAMAQGTAPMTELESLLDSAKAVEAPVFAPKTYLNAEDKLAEIKQAVELQKKQQSIDNLVADFRSYAENAIKASGVAKLSLSEYLEPRNKALKAKAPILVPELYQNAETQFKKATEKVESGNVKGGLKEAEKAGPLFDTAELEAIRVDILGSADKLIAAAVADEAPKYALTTLDKARTARERANDVLTVDRYERKESLDLAARAEYEARHASNIAMSVRALSRNDQAWEKLMLGYEIEMQKAATAAGIELLHFDNGPTAAADSLTAAIKSLKGKATSLAQESEAQGKQAEEQATTLVEQLSTTMTRFGSREETKDPLVLAKELDLKVAELMKNKSHLDSAMEVAAAKGEELAMRQAKEKKLNAAKALISPSEGEVFLNSANDLVLRLPGLSFDVGKSDIQDEHVPLLKKVREILDMFPDSKIMIEGHTDNRGDAVANTRLSEKRAFSVMQYFRQTMAIPADRIQAAGYGSDKPVATNDTPDGRAKNRRIDIIILQ